MSSSGDAPPPHPASLLSPSLPKHIAAAWSPEPGASRGTSARPARVAGTTLIPLTAGEGKTAGAAGVGGLPGNAGLGSREKAFAFLFVLFAVGLNILSSLHPHTCSSSPGAARAFCGHRKFQQSVHHTATYPDPSWVPDPLACLRDPSHPRL